MRTPGLITDQGSLGEAVFSPCRRYRYTLSRELGDGPALCAVLLNPSTADADQNDPTITRVIGFARRWGFGRLAIRNIFALRSTDPAGLRAIDDPVGPDNDEAIATALEASDAALVAWGAHGSYLDRATRVRELLAERAPGPVWSLGRTKAGEPKHPLYLPSNSRRVPYRVQTIAQAR